MGSALDDALKAEMARWEARGLRRALAPSSAGGTLADFTSNDTLSLAAAPSVVDAAREALSRYGAGGRASRLLGGGSPVHAQAEEAAAAWLGAEAALLFPSGYQATLGLLPALVGRGDVVYSDALDHASLIDAARLSRARVRVYAHGDPDDLERLLAADAGARRRLVLTEGVFSMDGDTAPLEALHALCVRYDAHLLAAEAHAAAVPGTEGRGAWDALGGGDDERLAARIVTGGKALGVAGAFVVGSRVLADHLVNRARTFLYTTAPSPAVAGGLIEAIRVVRSSDDARYRAVAVARRVAEALDLPPPAAAVVPFPVGSDAGAVELAAAARERGLDVRAIRPPTVPEGTARLRIACHAHNTDAEVDALVDLLTERPPTVAADAVAPTRPPLYVVGTDTDVGKTVVSAALLRAARAADERSGYWKPVQTGSDADTATVATLAGMAPADLPPPCYHLARPASPHEAAEAEGAAIDPDHVAATLRQRVDATAGRLIVELAGGLLVPYTLDGSSAFTQADLIARHPGDIVLVARTAVGTLNHTLLTLEALRARHLEPTALVLVGEPHAENAATLEALAGVDRVLVMPRLDPLDTAALDRWRAEHDLTFVR